MSDIVTLPVSPETFWGLVAFGAVLLAIMAVFGVLSGVKPEAEDTPFTRLRARLGMAGLPEPVFALGMILWGVIFSALFLGLLWTIISAAFHAPARTEDAQTVLRFILISLTALTATLGAVVAFPVTLIRIALTRKQTETAEEALFNDKINAAAEGLAARRQVTRVVNEGTPEEAILTEWEDDLVTRASAIDRLEGLAKERPDTAARVARMLSIYVRELSREYPAKDPPENQNPEEMWDWSRSLEAVRPDMEKAAQCLGRLQDIQGHNIRPGDINLSRSNLQGFDLNSMCFDDVLLTESRMQGGNFWKARLRGAQLEGTQLQGAYFGDALMQGANLESAQMQVAFVGSVRMDAKTNLTAVALRGASLRSVCDITLEQLRPFWSDVFSDGTVQLPANESRPNHWKDNELDLADFLELLRAWLSSLPDFDPSWRQG